MRQRKNAAELFSAAKFMKKYQCRKDNNIPCSYAIKTLSISVIVPALM